MVVSLGREPFQRAAALFHFKVSAWHVGPHVIEELLHVRFGQVNVIDFDSIHFSEL